jgi:hypothetical protein
MEGEMKEREESENAVVEEEVETVRAMQSGKTLIPG